MLKGKSVIELTDVHSGKTERYEDTNMVTEAVYDILNANLMGMLYDNTSFNGSSGEGWMFPLYKKLMGGILLYQNELEEREDNIYAPLDNPLIGYAADDANNTLDVRRGSRNLTESKKVDGGYRFVWDFQTSQANGTISAICLTNLLAGKGTKYDYNYMVRLGSWIGDRNANNNREIYLSNKRLFIEEGYRLEMLTRQNSDQAVLRKYKDDFLHGSLMDRPATRIVTEPEEETFIDLGHAPYYYHYTGGSKDGTEEPYTSSDIQTYLFHAADGKWYGIARRSNQKYSYTSGSKEYYNHVSYEWYMDTIEGDRCTSRKIVVPDGVSEFNSIGMSGKWLMCNTGNKLYRIDTTNVANIELVPDFTYSGSYTTTYIVDDDMVINGWYFYNGEPKLYLRETPYDSSISWGRGQMTRYKTFGLRESMYSSSYYCVYKELYLFTPYLATINNLGTPVIKTADKTMTITYTITEE